jgi:hypothetical protein
MDDDLHVLISLFTISSVSVLLFLIFTFLLSIVRRARMVSVGDNGIYTGSGLRGVIPYVRCSAVVFLS